MKVSIIIVGGVIITIGYLLSTIGILGLGAYVFDYRIERTSELRKNYQITRYIQGSAFTFSSVREKISYIPPFFPLIEYDIFDTTIKEPKEIEITVDKVDTLKFNVRISEYNIETDCFHVDSFD